MRRTSRYTLEENKDVLRKIDRVIVVLQEAGGTCTRDMKSQASLLSSTNIDMASGALRAVRESGKAREATDV
jgi:hypothetical protein